MPHESLSALGPVISRLTGQAFNLEHARETGGGCINRTWVVSGSGQRYFVKLNGEEALGMFEAEAAGLRALADSRCVRVPHPLGCATDHGQAILVMEYLELGGHGAQGDARLGLGLAGLHRCQAPEHGWTCDNTIGRTAQINTSTPDWVIFYRERRLRFQLELAVTRGNTMLLRTGEKLLAALPEFFTDYRPRPSLLHGDLWGGNHGALPDGTPVIFDPAVYYGDRETDIAMTELFGGFSPEFYAAYNEAWPLDPGYRTRRELYNLYHVLNHFNLFGGGYADQAERMMRALLAETR